MSKTDLLLSRDCSSSRWLGMSVSAALVRLLYSFIMSCNFAIALLLHTQRSDHGPLWLEIQAPPHREARPVRAADHQPLEGVRLADEADRCFRRRPEVAGARRG